MKRLIFLFVFLAAPLWAMDPTEMLDDPALEARARALDHALRCVRCQSESVASSNADWAQDARRSVRELIAGGATDQQVLDWFVERYGEFVLMDPPKTGQNLILWVAGPAMLLFALGVGASYLRRRSVSEGDERLNPEEEARLREILKQ